jgi:hypothetical protein
LVALVYELADIVSDSTVHNNSDVQVRDGNSGNRSKDKGDIYIMNSPLIQAIGVVLESAWTMLTRVRFPGTEIPIAIIITGAFVAGFGIRILAYVLKMSVNVGTGVDHMSREKEKERRLLRRRNGGV